MIVRKLEALFSFKVDKSQFNKATSAVDDFASHANKVLGAVAGYFAIQGIKEFVDVTTQAMANVGKTAGYLGITSQSLEEMRYAAQKSGVSIDTLDDSLKELQIRAVDAKSGTGEAAEAFAALGLKTTDAAGRMREPLELLNEVADRLQKLPTQSERIWVVDSMFGDQGAEMLKILKNGSLGLAQMQQEAKELGVTMDSDSVNSAMKYREAVSKLNASLGGMTRRIASTILPTLTSLVEISGVLWKSITSLIENTTIFRTVLITFCTILSTLALKALIAFAPFFAAAALFASIAVLVDDIWTAFEGGESVTKKVFDSIKSYFSSFKDWIGHIVIDIKKLLTDAIPDFVKKGFSTAVNFVGDTSNGSKQNYLAPKISNPIQSLKSNQNINISVKAQSGSSAKDIGAEIKKALKEELDKERFNAYMGVFRYADGN